MLGMAIAAGMVAGFGVLLLIRGATAPPVRLGDALAVLERRQPQPTAFVAEPQGWVERAQRRLRLPLSDRQQKLLLLQGRTVGDFFVEKMVWTLAGFFVPVLWSLTELMLGNPVGLTPLLVALAGAAGGFFVADVRLRTGAQQHQRAAVDGIHTFFDLVVLERLANASAAQASANAAAISDAPRSAGSPRGSSGPGWSRCSPGLSCGASPRSGTYRSSATSPT